MRFVFLYLLWGENSSGCCLLWVLSCFCHNRKHADWFRNAKIDWKGFGMELGRMDVRDFRLPILAIQPHCKIAVMIWDFLSKATLHDLLHFLSHLFFFTVLYNSRTFLIWKVHLARNSSCVFLNFFFKHTPPRVSTTFRNRWESLSDPTMFKALCLCGLFRQIWALEFEHAWIFFFLFSPK